MYSPLDALVHHTSHIQLMSLTDRWVTIVFHPGAQLPLHGPVLPNQHSQHPTQSSQSGNRLGSQHQDDATHPSPVHKPSSEYKTVPEMQRQGISNESAPSHSAPPQPNPDPLHPDHFSADPVGAQVPVTYTPLPQQGKVQYAKLDVGSAVQISDPPRYGVIRWIGELPNIQGIVAGIELVS